MVLSNAITIRIIVRYDIPSYVDFRIRRDLSPECSRFLRNGLYTRPATSLESRELLELRGGAPAPYRTARGRHTRGSRTVLMIACNAGPPSNSVFTRKSLILRKRISDRFIMRSS
ncbi:hypothetical protein NPIL_427801 [Nephila pilipes]|uniref:Uncharacterized protein n=1 Tax=Nephila pilipes TaxID=299642 RepID=A0A8X6PAD8_NEPPI|nr:hypothetical protein NPIL_427801 [Nephila pilipes]